MAEDKPVRIGVLLSGGGRTLLNILDRIEAGELNAEVAIVIASRPCDGIDRCRARGLNVIMVPYKDFGPDRLQDYSNAIVEKLDAEKVDLVILAGFLSKFIVPQKYLGRIMNIHPALLPSFGGKGFYGHHVHEAVVGTGVKISGCTVHFVTNEYDAGPIIVQRTVPVYDTDTPDDVADRVFEQECIAYPEAIKLFAQKRISIDGRIVKIKRD